MKKINYRKYIEEHTMDLDYSHRGGIIKVDVSYLFPNIFNAIAGASQNYLGGGLLGKVESGRNFKLEDLTEKERKIYEEFSEEVKKYFHELTNENLDEYSQTDYEVNQGMPKSGY